MALKAVDLTHVGYERLRAAVRATIEQQSEAVAQASHRLPTSAHLRHSAEAALQQSDDNEARYFQSILEIVYLVASADGFAESERKALAELLEQITSKVVLQDTLELHFKDLDETCEVLGRRERLRRAAADFDDNIGRAEALGFAALVAVADGHLAEPELLALRELGASFDLTEQQIGDTINDVITSVKRRLESGGA